MTVSPEPSHTDLFVRLQALVMSATNLEGFLTELADVSTTTVNAPVSCAITVRYDGNLLTVGSSDSRAEMLDETQYHAGVGPCLESLDTGTIVDCPDVLDEERWSEYTPSAIELGVRCSLCLPLIVDGVTLGALNLYGFEEANLFTVSRRRRLELLAAQAAGTLRVATRQLKDATLMAQMEEALLSRTLIDQALGIIMGQQFCTASAAFDLIRREARSSRRRLREVAADLITRTTARAPEPGRPFDAG